MQLQHIALKSLYSVMYRYGVNCHHHHHHHHELWIVRRIACSLTLKTKLAIPSLLWCPMFTHTKIKTTKQSHYRPGQAHRFPRGWGSQISRQLGHEGGKVVSHTQRPVFIPDRGRLNPRVIVRPEGLCQWKIPLTPSGIEQATFRLVVQCPKEMRHRLPPRLKQFVL
jgi:hypothetical protein